MALGQLLGACAGSSLAIRNGGTGLIRPVFLTVVFLTLLKVLYTLLTT